MRTTTYVFLALSLAASIGYAQTGTPALLGVASTRSEQSAGTNSLVGSTKKQEAWESTSHPIKDGLRVVTRWLPSADWIEVTIRRADSTLPAELHQVSYGWQPLERGQTRFDERRKSGGRGVAVPDTHYWVRVPREEGQTMIIRVEIMFPKPDVLFSSLMSERVERHDIIAPR